MDKKSLLASVISALQKEKENLEQLAASAHREAIEAPSPMESHSDKTKFEASLTRGHLEDLVRGCADAIRFLEHMDVSKFSEKIENGSLVEVEDSHGKKKCYFLLFAGRGLIIRAQETLITVIDPLSPLGKSLVGRRHGDIIEFEAGGGSKRLRVESVL